MEYASSVGTSRRREGVAGLEREGELKANNRRRVGVDGSVEVDAVGWRTGDPERRGDEGVTSVCSMELNIALACSLSASDSVGIMRFFDGVDGVAPSIKW